MKRIKALLLLGIILLSHFWLMSMYHASAKEGHADVYIICLSDVISIPAFCAGVFLFNAVCGLVTL
jgi:hypothetical protein